IIGLMAVHHAMPVSDKNVTVRCGDHIRGRIEHTRRIAGLARLAESHEHLAVGRELDDRMAFAVFAAAIGDPHIAGTIDIKTVWPIDEAAPEVCEYLSIAIQLHHGINFRTDASVGSAALVNPQCLAVALVDLYSNGSAEFATVWHLNREFFH